MWFALSLYVQILVSIRDKYEKTEKWKITNVYILSLINKIISSKYKSTTVWSFYSNSRILKALIVK